MGTVATGEQKVCELGGGLGGQGELSEELTDEGDCGLQGQRQGQDLEFILGAMERNCF